MSELSEAAAAVRAQAELVEAATRNSPIGNANEIGKLASAVVALAAIVEVQIEAHLNRVTDEVRSLRSGAANWRTEP